MEKMRFKKSNFEIPPEIFKEMQGKKIEYCENKSMKISFPIMEKYNNPARKMFGGMIAAAFDNTFGTFSYEMLKKACTTLELNTSFIRPTDTNDKELIVEVFLISNTKTQLILEGKAHNPDGKLIAVCKTRMMILDGF
ncbi:uncharacterized domain 1-containing protein [Desulfocicer vacuolatum DSM 3385]|uniref:Uncharacterized domain 1-containing protein n=1 Tax=Desulfocicer vacuolatum DSM 3385 TaxID=1121400 RepID=A0A1W2BIC5_9BACT|nr:PaaI family thioesterase [Desulfocicer vacuolatum]SMC72657.1 uncharacterized domain 1-containing protein [Desulfocicer vacuolatum DSM 3385]